jgi:hypothetical protein
MKPFPVFKYLTYARGFQRMVNEHSDAEGRHEEQRQSNIQALTEMAEESKLYSLLSTCDQFYRMTRTLERGGTEADFNLMIPDLLNRLEDDCKRLWIMMLDPDHIRYVQDSQPFDSKGIPTANQVSMRFPSASEDISEAGKCLALERSTACVMHLSRVMESGLKTLAMAVGVKHQNDWGKYLNEIDIELQKRFKTSGARTAEERFFAEAQITFDAVRRAWRNPTMHVDKTYTMERAEEIMLSVRLFMRHLASNLSE